MSDIDINRVLQNIGELQDQNAIDFQQWKRLGQEIERLEGKIKTTDNHLNLLMKKIKADYESLRKIIVDENVSIQLNNKILDNSIKINKNSTDIKTKADKTELEEVRKLVGQGVTDEQLKNAVQSKVDDGTIGSIQLGKNNVRTENIANKQVTPSKATFLTLDKTKNIFDGGRFLEGFRLSGDSSSASIAVEQNGIIAIVEINHNTTYTIMVDENDLELEYNGKKYFKYMTSSTLYTGAQSNATCTLNSACYGTSFTFTTTENDNYLYIFVSESGNRNALIQVLEGTHSAISISSYEECYYQNFNLKYNFLEVNNLFDGKSYLDNISISGSSSADTTLAKSANCITAIVPIEGNKEYSVILSETPMTYNDYTFFKWVTSDTLYKGAVNQGQMRIGKFGSVKNNNVLNFLSSATDKYLYIYTNDTNRKDILIEVVEGKQKELTISQNGDNYKFNDTISVYSKQEVLNLIDEAKPTFSKYVSPLKNKTWVFLGDSITFGTGCSAGHDYPSLIKNQYGVNVINGAIAGGRYAKVSGSGANDYCIAQQILNQAENIKKADIVSIKCGTNDFANVVPFGEVKSTNEYDFNGGINNAISAIYGLNPKIKIVLFTPIYRATQSYTDDKNSDDYPLGGKYLREYCSEIEKGGKRHHVPVFNLNDISGINRYNATIMLSDKLHLSDSGSEYLAPTIHGCVATLF